MVSNSELRKRTRDQLGNSIFATNWLMALVVCLIYDLIISGAGYLAIVGVILSGPMAYGLATVTLKTVRGKGNIDLVDEFDGFKFAGDTIVLGLLRYIFIFLWSLLLIIPGIIKSYSYSMASYIQYDSEDKSWKHCIDDSRAMMDGNKWRLFCLDLSFIGWYIVGFLCLGIGILFVIPYHEFARANFYEELKGKTVKVSEPAETVVEAKEEAEKVEETAETPEEVKETSAEEKPEE